MINQFFLNYINNFKINIYGQISITNQKNHIKKIIITITMKYFSRHANNRTPIKDIYIVKITSNLQILDLI